MINIIKANKIILEDDAGNMRLALDAGDLGIPSITFYNLDATPKLRLAAGPGEAASIVINGNDGARRMTLGLGPDNAVLICFHDQKGISIASLAVIDDGGAIRIMDAEKNVIQDIPKGSIPPKIQPDGKPN